MSKELVQVFNFNDAPIRTVEHNGEVLFVAKDIAELLGYTNTSKAINDHCKGVTKRYLLTSRSVQVQNNDYP